MAEQQSRWQGILAGQESTGSGSQKWWQGGGTFREMLGKILSRLRERTGGNPILGGGNSKRSFFSGVFNNRFGG